MLKIALDIDGVVVDLLYGVAEFLKINGYNMLLENYTRYKASEVDLGCPKQKVIEAFQTPLAFELSKFYPNIQNSIDKLREFAIVDAYTLVMNQGVFDVREKQLKELGFEEKNRKIFLGEKPILINDYDILIEDTPDAVIGWREKGFCGLIFLVNQIYNLNYDMDNYCIRVNSLDDIVKFIQLI